MRKGAPVTSLWLLTTLFAMVMVAMAVQLAGAKVTDRPTINVSRRQIENEIAATSTTVDNSVRTPPPAPGPGDEVPNTVEPVPTTTEKPKPPPSTLGPRTTTTAPHSGDPTPAPPPPPTTFPPTTTPPTVTVVTKSDLFVLTGGTVQVRCNGTAVALLSSSPKGGFQMMVASAAKAVYVQFRSETHESLFKATCNGTTIVPEIKEQAVSS